MRRDIIASITIPAPPAAVWAALADLPAWQRWNPLVTSVAGELETGVRLRLCLELPGYRPRIIRPEVMRVLPAEELGWILRHGPPGLLDWEHRVLLESPDDGDTGQTLLIQRTRLSGILLPLFWRRLQPALSEGLHRSNRALRDAVLPLS